MPPKKQPPTTNLTAIGDGNVQVAGDNNTVNVNQTFIQRVINNIFKSDAETTDQRNRRIMLGHVENFWVKGILEKSLYGAALLELGIKEDPDAVTYPWAIKREATKETLPVDKSMLEIYQEIGMGRALLILGAPGAGKTTMLLELARQLIERAREDVIEPIPVVFNLSSWTEKFTLDEWLVRELNIIYSIPKKTAPTWLKDNKMLLLLDGLDEVQQESRDKCIDAINRFRKENGLTSLAVCSRIQDYREIKTRLAFDGAIEIQPLTPGQVNEYFERFGERFVGIRQMLEKDITLREMAETPLFLNVMMLAYRGVHSDNILISEKENIQRKHLFDVYIERMFERSRSSNNNFNKQNTLRWLAWLSQKMIKQNTVPYFLEEMKWTWLNSKLLGIYALILWLIFSLMLAGIMQVTYKDDLLRFGSMLFIGAGVGLIFAIGDIQMGDTLTWAWAKAKKAAVFGLMGPFLAITLWVLAEIEAFKKSHTLIWDGKQVTVLIILALAIGLFFGLNAVFVGGLTVRQIGQTIFPGQRITASLRNSILVFLLIMASLLSTGWLMYAILDLNRQVAIPEFDPSGIISLSAFGLLGGLFFGGAAVIRYYILHFILAVSKNIPWKLVSFLNNCVDLIFLRRVGGGYIFVHRLLMEHFAAMYKEE